MISWIKVGRENDEDVGEGLNRRRGRVRGGVVPCIQAPSGHDSEDERVMHVNAKMRILDPKPSDVMCHLKQATEKL